MNTINIENKEYVVLPRKEYEDLRTKATVKAVGAKKLSLADGRISPTNSLINGQKESNDS